MTMGYKIIPRPADWNNYSERPGLEGPFLFNGNILYYDPKEGKYYNPKTDMFLSNEEFYEVSK